MKLHIFNPEHDIAMASNISTFTAPHAARELRSELGYIPALWAEQGDLILVEDVEAAIDSVRHLKCDIADVLFVIPEDLSAFQLTRNDTSVGQLEISPWGWDSALKYQLSILNPDLLSVMPSDEYLLGIRDISSRKWGATYLLPQLVASDDLFIGKSEYIEDMDSLRSIASSLNKSVIKAPWSSSGRGIRYIEYPFTCHQEGWAANIIRKQGGIMIEPYYNKVKDFGVEFESVNGEIVYNGLSLFKTINGAYTGNIIASDDEKRQFLSRYISINIIDRVCDAIIDILTPLFKGKYTGPFGIDMMIVADDEHLKLHPCVELNLRRTMGHVALSLAPKEPAPQRLMRITYTNKYRMRLSDTHENVIKNTIL